MHLLHSYILQQNPKFKIHTFSGWPAGLSNSESSACLTSSVGAGSQDIFVAQDRVIFIDDTQSSYYDDSLWGFLKLMEPNFGAYFVLFSAYGSPGPYTVQMKTGIPPVLKAQQRISLNWESGGDPPLGLLLKPDEAKDLLSRACANDADRPILSEDLCDLLSPHHYIYGSSQEGSGGVCADSLLTNKVH